MPKGKHNQTVAQRLVTEAKSRLKEVEEQLGPLVGEKNDLEGLLNKSPVEEIPAPAASAPKPERQRRSRKGGTRGEQAIALIKEQPGISASEIAKQLKIKPNYMYRVLSDAVQSGEVKKEGREYQPA